ncbi:hypothetical protein C0Q70_20765 [Pomacea canaliculata]|nr:hypothetical protein C0Q70_20765 [Pomacea canaliculata]
MFRKWKDSKGKEKEYENIIRKQVQATKEEAERDGVKVPMTLQEYCVSSRPPQDNQVDADFYDDDDYVDDVEDEEMYQDEDDMDSGNEEC